MNDSNTVPGARPRLLNVGKIAPALLARLAHDYDLTDLAGVQDLGDRLQGEAASFRALVTSAPVGVSAEVMAALPGLQVISSFGVGLDRIDLAAARARGIQVGYTPHVLDDCVADAAMGLVVDVARGLSAADRYVRAGHWQGGPFATMRKASGARMGVVGFGRIGQQIAARAAGFRMEVRYHARQPASQVALPHEPSLHALARWADFLVLALPGGPATRHIVDAAVLEALGPEGFLVNIARQRGGRGRAGRRAGEPAHRRRRPRRLSERTAGAGPPAAARQRGAAAPRRQQHPGDAGGDGRSGDGQPARVLRAGAGGLQGGPADAVA